MASNTAPPSNYQNASPSAEPDSLRSFPKKQSGGPDDVFTSLPVSETAERAVLSCMLKSQREKISDAQETLTPDFFYIPAHRKIYETLSALFDEFGKVDLITLTEELERKKILEEVGGRADVAALLDDVPTTAFFDHYASILKDKFILRRIIDTCTNCVQDAYGTQGSRKDEDKAGATVTELLDTIEKNVLAIRDAANKEKGNRTIHDHVMKVIDSIAEMHGKGDGLTGISSGLRDLDKITNGLQRSEMMVIAARPSMGKTSLVMNILENITMHADNPMPAAFFSLEMSAEQIVQRLLCSRARIDMQKLRSGFLSKPQLRQLMTVAQTISKSPLYIDDTPALTIMELRAKARRLHDEHGIKIIAIDYLQLCKSPGAGRQESRQVEIAEISSGIKALAKELDIPIIVLAQLNRAPDARGGGKPKLSDLRESGAIEQDADFVGLLVREEYYAEDEEERQSSAGRAVLHVAKQRNGPTGEVPMTFRKEMMRFENAAEGEYEV
ncbi:MAG: replicative DNA helicase [Verrucomicrobiales bacterium]|nr:replicative DNA helicase [Verrucomicrobiales bacterium]